VLAGGGLVGGEVDAVGGDVLGWASTTACQQSATVRAVVISAVWSV
jgi:hypothetical protein